jgi:pyruvate formate lyase activating enzyme
MDIKNCREKYALTAGMNEDAFSIAPIEESVQILLRSKTEYEFRTTVVRKFHTAEDIAAIGQWIKGADRYVLQQFEDSGQMIQAGLTAVSPEEMEEMRNAAAPYVRETEIRGIKGI